jgi:hypothetical protein
LLCAIRPDDTALLRIDVVAIDRWMVVKLVTVRRKNRWFPGTPFLKGKEEPVWVTET